MLILVSLPLEAQLSGGGKPEPFNGFRRDSSWIRVPGPDRLKSLEDQEAYSGKKPFRFAEVSDLSVNPEEEGEWFETGDGRNIWRLGIHAPSSYALGLVFDRYRLEGEAVLFIYTPDQKRILGGFNHSNNKPSGIFPVDNLPGDQIIVELQVPAGQNYGELSIGKLSKAFVDIFGTSDARFGLAGSCNININCPEGDDWQVVKRAVCRILIISKGEYCSGTLINNALNDGKAYLYAANHCIGTSADAQSSVFVFGYESPSCISTDGSVANSLSSAQLLATSDSLDFSLLLLNETPPESYKPYFAGWTISETPPSSGICIHHPLGDVMKISYENNTLLTTYQTVNPPTWLTVGSVPQAFWRVQRWDKGTTQGGSSGSALFNSSKKIVGNLTGGDATCPNPVNDYFSKFFMNWDYYPQPEKSLKSWLGPLPDGIKELSGFDPLSTGPGEDIDPFQLFPNPNNGRFRINVDSQDLSGYRLRIYNLQGHLLADYSPSPVPENYFDLSHLPSGYYILEIRTNVALGRKKLLIAK